MTEKKIDVNWAGVVSNQRLAKDIWEIVLDAGEVEVIDFNPGQFVCLEPLEKSSAMARPFSISRINALDNYFSLIYKVVGLNTKLLSLLSKGAKIKFWGPLGNGLLPPLIYAENWLIGGGLGIAPLRFFERLISGNPDRIAKVFYGAKSKDDIIQLGWRKEELLEVATEDGSVGYHGLVTDLLNQKILESHFQEILVITCGPKPMMKQVAELCTASKIDCYVILERIMACGIGACLGCSIKTTKGMKRVCHDGPVFKAEEVIWDEI